MVLLRPSNWNGRAVIWLASREAALFASDGSPISDVKRLLDAGFAVFGVDLFIKASSCRKTSFDGEKSTGERNPRQFAGYTYGYNYSLLAQRCARCPERDRLCEDQQPPTEVSGADCPGWDSSDRGRRIGTLRSAVNRAAIDTRGFRFGKLTDYLDANFLPGGANTAIYLGCCHSPRRRSSWSLAKRKNRLRWQKRFTQRRG